MIGRLIYAAAALVLVISLVGLGVESSDVVHYPQMLPGDVPAVIYEPGPTRGFGERGDYERKLPVVVLCHGFTVSMSMMSSLARRMAQAGYAVVSIDFRGHGQNHNPFASASKDGGLLADIDAALLYARLQPEFDGQNIVLMGHSMGASAVLQHAERDPGVSAVVAISGGGTPRGPYTPPNTLMIWATGDPARARTRFRLVAEQLAEREQLVADRTYGDPARGTGVRISEVDGTDHVTILYSRVAAQRILDWLKATAGPGVAARADPLRDGRVAHGLVGIAAALVLIWGLPLAIAPLARRLPHQTLDAPLRRLGAFAASLLVGVVGMAGLDSVHTGGPLHFIPIIGAREVFGVLALSGFFLVALGARSGRVRGEAFDDRRTWISAALLFAFVYTALGTLTAPFNSSFPAAPRLIWIVLATLLMLPFFGAAEWYLRGAGPRGIWLPAVGKLLVLLVLGGGAMVGVLPGVILLGVGIFALFFIVFELLAYRVERLMPNPWVMGIFQSAYIATAFGAVFPFQG